MIRVCEATTSGKCGGVAVKDEASLTIQEWILVQVDEVWAAGVCTLLLFGNLSLKIFWEILAQRFATIFTCITIDKVVWCGIVNYLTDFLGKFKGLERLFYILIVRLDRTEKVSLAVPTDRIHQDGREIRLLVWDVISCFCLLVLHDRIDYGLETLQPLIYVPTVGKGILLLLWDVKLLSTW